MVLIPYEMVKNSTSRLRSYKFGDDRDGEKIDRTRTLREVDLLHRSTSDARTCAVMFCAIEPQTLLKNPALFC